MALFRVSMKKSQKIDSDLPTNMDETIDDFCREVMKALWHVYDMLDTVSSGTVHVSQLKVITSSIGQRLGVDKAEQILDQDGVTSMDFRTYFNIIKKELLDQQQLPENHCDLGSRLNGIIKTCWTTCNYERRNMCKTFTLDHGLLLWRLYNFLSDTEETGNPVFPVRLDPEEAALLLKDFVDVTGQKNKEAHVKQFLADSGHEPLNFTDFLNVFEKGYAMDLSSRGITQGLNRLNESYILNVLLKGMMWKRGHKVKSWKERYLVLTPTHLKYYVAPDERVMKGSIEFDSDCSVEVLPDRPTNKPNRFVVHTKKKPYEMSASDLKSKNEWVSAIQQALSRVGGDPNIQKDAALERCRARAERRRLATEEERKRREEAELLKQRQDELNEAKKKRLEDEELLRARLFELEEEKRRREEAEARWQEEQALRELEQQRLRELEEIKRELERLLAEERQAKKDEEIVRNLQSRLLEEEFEKREELERLKQQQEEMLKAEREQKAVLESDRLKQEQLLAEAQARLDQLEQERAAAAEKMQEAAEKLQKAEKDRHIMEEKVKLWKTPVGLARPIQPHAEPLVTHRGLGAFCERDFVRKVSTDVTNDKKTVNDEKETVGNEVEQMVENISNAVKLTDSEPSFDRLDKQIREELDQKEIVQTDGITDGIVSSAGGEENTESDSSGDCSKEELKKEIYNENEILGDTESMSSVVQNAEIITTAVQNDLYDLESGDINCSNNIPTKTDFNENTFSTHDTDIKTSKLEGEAQANTCNEEAIET